jgi:hypothetical protein
LALEGHRLRGHPEVIPFFQQSLLLGVGLRTRLLNLYDQITQMVVLEAVAETMLALHLETSEVQV